MVLPIAITLIAFCIYSVYVIGESILANNGDSDIGLIIATLLMATVGLVAGILQKRSSKFQYLLALPFVALSLFFLAGVNAQHLRVNIIGPIIILTAAAFYLLLFKIGVKIRGFVQSRK